MKELAMTLGYCPSCGAPRTGQPFCGQCGQRFDAAAPAGSPTKQLARSAITVQNLQIMMIGGMIVGFVVGVLIAAYVILPMSRDNALLMLIAVFTPIIGIWAGSRVVLALVAR
jgi:uncharacterized membrane protein YvbJ